MQYYFPKFRLFTYLIAVLSIGITVAVFWPIQMEFSNLLPMLVFFIVLAAVGALALKLYIEFVYKRRIQDILFLECNPERFLAVVSPGIEKARKTFHSISVSETSYLFMYAVGLADAGNVQQAIHEMETLAAHLPQGAGIHGGNMLYASLYWNNLATFYLQQGEEEKARTALRKSREALQNGSEFQRQQMETSWAWNENNLFVLQGETTPALQFFCEQLPAAGNKRSEVLLHKTLTDIYEKLGDAEQYRQCLIFVAENGGTMAIAKQAREVLEIPDAQAPARLAVVK